VIIIVESFVFEATFTCYKDRNGGHLELLMYQINISN